MLHRLVAFLLIVAAATSRAQSDDLVTPIRIGRPDAPLVISMWAQQEYSHLAAREDQAQQSVVKVCRSTETSAAPVWQ